MCHEAWWRERRARRDEEEVLQIWRDFEAIWPADAPEVPDERPEEVRLDTEKQEPVSVER
jgi:hypothetical protein